MIPAPGSNRRAVLRPVSVILSEAERMASIVKRIGRITKYETVAYVGGARMLDLHRAAPESESGDRDRRGDHREFLAPTGPPAGPPPQLVPGPPADLRDLDDSRGQGVELAPPTAEAEIAALRELATELGTASSEPVLVKPRARHPDPAAAQSCAVRAGARRAHRRAGARLRARRPAAADRGGRADHHHRGPALRAPGSSGGRGQRPADRARIAGTRTFTGIATGVAIPLAAGGELYGALDVGYAPNADARAGDEPRVQAFAAPPRESRCARCGSPTTPIGLRDYHAPPARERPAR